MSTFIKIPGVNPPSTRPQVDRMDPIMPERGALSLLDVTHPANPWGTGVPVNDQVVPNLASVSLAELSGQSGPAIQGYTTSVDIDAHKIRVSRSAKGGVQMARMEATTITGQPNKGYSVRYPRAVLEYVMANPSHSYYVSLWARLTHNNDKTHAWGMLTASTSRNEKVGYLYVISNANINYPNSSTDGTGATRIGYRREPMNTRSLASSNIFAEPLPHPWLANIGVSNYAGVIDSTMEGTELSSRIFGVGSYSAFGTGAVDLVGGTFYRGYLEDLTVSGRTYAQVDALEKELYNKEVMTAGGRYFGDTVPA